jgi:hypothetical protein
MRIYETVALVAVALIVVLLAGLLHLTPNRKPNQIYVHELKRYIDVAPAFWEMPKEEQNAEVDRIVHENLQKIRAADQKDTVVKVDAFGWKFAAICLKSETISNSSSASATLADPTHALDNKRCSIMGRGVDFTGEITKEATDYGIKVVAALAANFSKQAQTGSARCAAFRPTVSLSSPGGSVVEAVRLGRAIRSAGVDTQVQIPIPETGDWDGTIARARCDSACAFVFFAGMKRLNHGFVGLHRPYLSTEGVHAGVSPQELSIGLADARRLLDAYFEDLGLERSLLDFLLRIEPESIEEYPRPASPVPMYDIGYREWHRLNCQPGEDERERQQLITRFGSVCGDQIASLKQVRLRALEARCVLQGDRPGELKCPKEIEPMIELQRQFVQPLLDVAQSSRLSLTIQEERKRRFVCPAPAVD